MQTTVTRQGDTFDILAKRLYGDEHYMHVLINANIQHRKTVIFPYGVVLNVPEVDTAADNTIDMPPWKR